MIKRTGDPRGLRRIHQASLHSIHQASLRRSHQTSLRRVHRAGLALVHFAILLLAAPPLLLGAEMPGDTPLHRNGYSRISTSAEISADLAAIATASPLARVETIGQSVQGRPLETLVFKKPGDGTERLRVLIVGSQHGAAEPAGSEALLTLARALAFGDLRPLLDELDIVLFPNANPDGRDLDRRTNANGVNINTDFVLAREPETRALLAALDRYQPQALLDSHESAVLKRKSLGLEGWLTDFEIQFEFANNPGVPGAVREFSERELLPALLAATSTEGAKAHRYIGEITSTRQPITNGGLTLRNFRNAAGVQNRVSMLVETRLDSRELSYPTWRNIAVREARQLHCLRTFLAVVHNRRAAIRAATAQPVRGGFALHASYQPALDHPQVAIGLRRRDTGELVTHHFADHRRVALADAVAPPPAYLVTAAQDLIRPVLDAQGITYRQLDSPRGYRVLEEHFKLPTAAGGRVTLVHSIAVTREAPAGSLVIELAQRRGRQAVLLLDPRSTSSLFRYPEFAARLGADEPPPVQPVLAVTGGNP